MHLPPSRRIFRSLALIFILVLPLSVLKSQPNKSVLIDGHLFGLRQFVDGEPNFPPVKRWLVSGRSYATIALPESLGTIYFCSGQRNDSLRQIYLLYHLADQTWTRTPLDLSQSSSDTLRTSLDLPLLRSKGKETPFPLDIRIALSGRSLLFRWMLSPDNDKNPGGSPMPADILLDVDKELFPFDVRDLSGQLVGSSELRGKVTMVDWWFTSCVGCVLEIPGFNQLVQKYKSRVQFLAVAIDDPKIVRSFLVKHPFHFRQTIASDSIYRYIGGGVPHTIVVDERGIVRFDRKGGGPESYKDFDQAIDSLLAKKQN